MNGMERLVHDKMRAAGADTYQRFLCQEVIHNWSKLVDEDIAAQVTPVALEHGVLFVEVKNSAFKDQLKFFAEEIIDAVNEHAETPLVKEIRPAKPFQIAAAPKEGTRGQGQGVRGKGQGTRETVDFDTITLTAEEIKRCVEQAVGFANDELRQTVLNTLLSQARAQKFRLANGWHKCADCDTLCPPEEIFCNVCKIRARTAMVEELYRIFYDEPRLTTRDAQKILLERMPQMRAECLPEAVESARTSLIQKVAAGIRFGDEDSPDVLKLVALQKRLPPDKITPAIIRRTLLDLQFNLPSQALPRRYDTLKPRK